jgi:hypothetical protein
MSMSSKKIEHVQSSLEGIAANAPSTCAQAFARKEVCIDLGKTFLKN